MSTFQRVVTAEAVNVGDALVWEDRQKYLVRRGRIQDAVGYASSAAPAETELDMVIQGIVTVKVDQ